MKTHGDSGWEKFPSYLDTFIPYVLEILDSLNLKITFFVVGRDAANERNTEALKLLVKRGHDVGNHSYNHDPWFNLNSKELTRKEVLDAEEQIIKVTGQKPIGFRSPGFKWTPKLLEVLADNDYFYDSSVHSTYIGPLTRFFYFKRASFTDKEKNERKKMIGISEVTKPNVPFFWRLSSGVQLLELPVTTTPMIRIPFHLSYLLFLCRYSYNLMFLYLRIALMLCWLRGLGPTFVIHPPDLLDRDLVPDLDYFPGMEISVSAKVELFRQVIDLFGQYFELHNLNTYAHLVCKSNLREKKVGTTERLNFDNL